MISAKSIKSWRFVFRWAFTGCNKTVSVIVFHHRMPSSNSNDNECLGNEEEQQWVCKARKFMKREGGGERVTVEGEWIVKKGIEG